MPMIEFGDTLRQWRKRRRLSQLDLAHEADISQRHVSFLESGRARPSREMALRLAEHLELPIRDRNTFLVSAGFAPEFSELDFDDDGFAPMRHAIETMLTGLEPNPSFAVDRYWTLIASNAAANVLFDEVSADLLAPPVNVLRVCLHPSGLGKRVLNYDEWRAGILAFLHRQVTITADPRLADLHAELTAYRRDARPARPETYTAPPPVPAMPLRLASADGDLTFVSTVTVFGTPTDITLAELAIETYFPLDETTAAHLRKRARRKSAER